MVKRSVQMYLVTTLLVAGTTLLLWLLRDVLTPANFSLAYLLVVLICAIYQGIGVALFAALISFLCFNYFLIQPLYTFHVADPREVLNLLFFLTSAVLTGQLANYARKQTQDARQRADEQNVLYELTSVFNQLTDADSIVDALKQALHQNFAVCRVDMQPNFPCEVEAKTRPEDQNALYLLIHTGDGTCSTLRVTFDHPPSPSLQRLLSACGVQMSMALHRIALAQRAQQSRTFEEADRLKTALLHAVSHDLRTPITIIKTSASNLLNLSNALSENERIDMLRAIETEADNLDKMVGNLLDISRLKAGAMTINSAWNSLEEVAGEIAARIWQRIHEERIKIDFPDDMPLVKFDYGLILQALANLVENSLRYEPDGSKIAINGRFEGNEARVAIVNHGPNIPANERDMIMEPFYHGSRGHTGLGLAIARGIVEAHQGRLWVEDTPGSGATFVVALPLDAMPIHTAGNT